MYLQIVMLHQRQIDSNIIAKFKVQQMPDMEQKQRLLRQQVLQKGYDPAKFYQYWESLNMEFQNVELEQLKIIVDTYVKTYVQYSQTNYDEQFDEFQDSSLNNGDKKESPKKQKDVYADFNWDFLMTKPSQQTKKDSEKKQIKKLPKTFQKPSQKTTQQQRKPKYGIKKSIESQGIDKTKIPKKNIQKSIDLIEDFDASLVQSKEKNLQAQQSVGNVQKSVTITFKQIESQSKKGKIKCLKLKQNILDHHKNVEITIPIAQEYLEDNSSLINKIWKGNEYMYQIKTIGRNKNRSVGVSWDVKRKYSDFQWLRTTLLKFYPGIVVPPLPAFPKNKDKLPGQKKKLQNFLMDAYRCPQLRNSKYFEIFLSYGNFSDFQGFKKTTQTVTKPKVLANILNMTGELELLHGASIDIFATGMQQYLNKSSQHLKNVKNILNDITSQYDSISNCYTKLADVFDLMSKQSCQFSQEKCFPKLTETYKQIGSLIQKHSKFCQQEKSNIQTYMISHFSYEKDRIDNMQTLINKKTQFSTQLGKRQPKQEGGGMFGKLAGGVSSLFGQKVEYIDIPSSKYETLYEQVGFYNNQLLNEMVRCVEVMIQSQVQHFSGYGISRIDSVDNLQKTWSEIMVELSKLNLQ